VGAGDNRLYAHAVGTKELERLMADKSPFGYESAMVKERGREVCTISTCNWQLDTTMMYFKELPKVYLYI